MQTCDKTQEYLLRDDWSAAARAHFEVCETCQLEVKAWQAVKDTMDKWDPSQGLDVTSNPQNLAKLQDASREQSNVLFGARRIAITATALAAGIAVVVALALINTSETKETYDAYVELSPFEFKTISSQNAQVKDEVNSHNKTVSTGKHGGLLLDLEGDQFGLDENTKATFSKTRDGEIHVALLRGTIGVSARKRHPKESLFIDAAGTRVAVKGTEFQVELSKGRQVQVNVVEGTVKVTAPNGNELLLRKGDSCLAADSQVALTRVSPQQRQRLERLLAQNDIDKKPVVPELIPSRNTETKTVDEQSEIKKHQSTREPSLSDAKALILDGQTDEAAQALKQLVVKTPKNVEAWMLLATSWRKMGKWREAASAFDEAVIHGNTNEANRARFMAAVIYQDKLGDHSKANQLLESYLKDGSVSKPLESKVLLRLVRAKVALGDRAGAAAISDALNKRYPGTEEASYAANLVRGN